MGRRNKRAARDLGAKARRTLAAALGQLACLQVLLLDDKYLTEVIVSVWQSAGLVCLDARCHDTAIRGHAPMYCAKSSTLLLFASKLQKVTPDIWQPPSLGSPPT